MGAMGQVSQAVGKVQPAFLLTVDRDLLRTDANEFAYMYTVSVHVSERGARRARTVFLVQLVNLCVPVTLARLLGEPQAGKTGGEGSVVLAQARMRGKVWDRDVEEDEDERRRENQREVLGRQERLEGSGPVRTGGDSHIRVYSCNGSVSDQRKNERRRNGSRPEVMKTSAYRQAVGLLLASESIVGVSEEEEANRRDTQQLVEWTGAGRKQDWTGPSRVGRQVHFSRSGEWGASACRLGWGPAEGRVFDQL